MAICSNSQLSLEVGICSFHGCSKRFQNSKSGSRLCLLGTDLSSVSLGRCRWSTNLQKLIRRRARTAPSKNYQFECHCFLNSAPPLDATFVKNVTSTLARSFSHLQGNPLVIKLASAVGIVSFAIWGLGPLVRQSRNIFLRKSDSSWKRSSTYHVTTSYIQPLLLWIGAIFICKALDPIILQSEASQIVKQRVLNFIRSLSTVWAFAHCLSSLIQQTQNFFMDANDPTDTRNMGFQFAGRAVYTAIWVAAVSLFMELLGFSTQKWITAGGLGTVLLTLAGREILTNFLSGVMMHATRPFILNDWIQTKIEGYEVSGTVEHVGWWSPTIIRGDDREAVHIPNHKFTVNVVRNLSQKTHWRIKTHLAISHLDVAKVNNIVADMRKVLAKNPQVEQQKLHRRVFLDDIDPENQALKIMVSCFVKTSRYEEYSCVKEAIVLDLLRVVSHHRARLATPIRTIQKIYRDADLDGIPFSDSIFTRGAASNRPLLLIEPSYKITGEDKTKPQARSTRLNADEDSIAPPRSTVDETTSTNNTKSGETESKDVITPPSDPRVSYSMASSTSQTKQDARQPVSQTKPSLEENIVLGVALEGSKRTLPIEEDKVTSPSPEDTMELAALRNSNGQEKSETTRANGSGSPGGDQVDQQE